MLNGLRLIISDSPIVGENGSADIQDMCSNIKLSSSLKKITTELQFTYNYEYNDYKFDLHLGDSVILSYNGKVLFRGKITDTEFNKKSNSYTITCFDIAWWAVKNNVTMNLKPQTAREAIEKVLTDIGLPLVGYEKNKDINIDGVMIEKHLISNKKASDVMLAIIGDIAKQTGVYHYISMDQDGYINILECDKYFSCLTIKESSPTYQDGNLIDYKITRSIQNMINKVKLYDENYEFIDEYYAEPRNENYGIIQDTIRLNEDDDASVEANKAKIRLDKYGQPSEELYVKCIGDFNYKPGYGVVVKIKDTMFYDRYMYITGSEWTFTSNGEIISELLLTTSRVHDITEWDSVEDKEEEESTSTGGSAGSEAVENAVNFMIDIANNDKHGYSQPNRWSGIDYDCSSLVITAFEQAGIPLKTNGATYTGNMKQAALKCGFEDINWNGDFASLKRGDILLNEVKHTALYIGNNKEVEASTSDGHPEYGDQTGKEIIIREVRNYPWNCVLRYKIEDSKTTISGGTTLNEAVNATTQAEFAAAVAPACKELYKKYKIFPSVQISCWIQESWTGSGLTKLAKQYYNIGGIKTSSSSQKVATDYKTPGGSDGGNYRAFDSLADFMEYWNKMISGGFGGSIGATYKSHIADKTTATDQANGFNGSGYCPDGAGKARQMLSIIKSNNLTQYD